MAKLEEILTADHVDKLQDQWITSVDDLYTVLEEDEPAVARLLDMSDEDVSALHRTVRRLTERSFRNAVEEQGAVSHPLDDVQSTDRDSDRGDARE